MTLRRPTAVLFVALIALPGAASAATYSTANFTVTAPDEQMAKRFAQAAEDYRREKAIAWLGQEMPQWPQRCPLRVTINGGGAGGATTFTFGTEGGRGVVTSRQMEIRGDYRQLLYSVLPHEVTHTVLAEHFGKPVPRWADEGGSVLSENEEERFSHDVRCRELLNAGRGFRLRVLFQMTEYPQDLMVLYAQGYSITDYLVRKGGDGQEGRQKLLRFLGIGMQGSSQRSHGTPATWNAAAQQVYGFDTIDALETAWLDSLQKPPTRTAARTTGTTATPTARPTDPGTKADLRSSAAPAMPLLEPPVKAVRAAPPSDEPTRPTTAPTGTGPNLATRPTALPPTSPVSTPVRPMAPDYPPPPLLGPPELPRPAGSGR